MTRAFKFPVLLSLSLLLLTPTLTLARPPGLIPGLILRQSSPSAGGFATRSAECTPDQVDCGGGIAQEICCPAGMVCFNSSDGVCCPSGETGYVDCTQKSFAAPSCADPTWFLCTDYQPSIPGFVPHDPGYWCCPSGTQCLVTENAGFVCKSAAEAGDVAGSSVGSGMAPTQASTATTLPTGGGTVTGSVTANGGSSGKGGATGTKGQSTQGGSTHQNTTPTATATGTGTGTPAKSGGVKIEASSSVVFVAVAVQALLVVGGMYLV